MKLIDNLPNHLKDKKETKWSRYKTNNSTRFNDRGKNGKTRNQRN